MRSKRKRKRPSARGKLNACTCARDINNQSGPLAALLNWRPRSSSLLLFFFQFAH